MNAKTNLGAVTAYAIAVKHGYTGTEEEWAKQFDNIGEYVAEAKADITNTGATEAGKVAAKGAEVLASIPADYTELSNDVALLSEDIATVSELSGTYEVPLTFDPLKDGHYINTSGGDRTVANAKISEPVHFTKGTLIKFKVQGQANVFGIIAKVNTDGTYTVVRISDTSTYKWYEYKVPSDGDYVFCGYYNRFAWELYANTQKQFLIDELIESKTKIFDNQPSYNGVSLICKDNDEIYFDIIQIYDTVVRVINTETNEVLPIKNIRTGNTYNYAGTVDTYVVDTRSIDKIRFDDYHSSLNSPITLTAYSTLKNKELKVEYMSNSGDAPIANVSVVKRQTNVMPQDYLNGVIYARSMQSNSFNKSTDGGVNWSTLKTFEQPLHRCVALDNGYFLIIKDDNTMVRTNDFTNFTTVLTFGLKPHVLFGINKYKNHVLMSEYGGAGDGNPGRIVHYSKDYGATWAQIFDLADWFNTPTGWHLHSASFDPYEQLIWVCCGDGKHTQMFFVSFDYGNTFVKCGEFDNMPTQATYIAPLKDCVLFLSDSRLVSCVRYNRPKTGTSQSQKFKFELAYIFAESWGKDSGTEVPIASTAYVDYKKSICYFGYALIGNSLTGKTNELLSHGAIFATNGYSTKTLYSESASVNGGVQGIWGDGERIVSDYVDVRHNSLCLDITNVTI